MRDEYSNAFKEMLCIEICIEHRSIVNVSREYNMCKDTVKLWINEYVKNPSCFSVNRIEYLKLEDKIKEEKKKKQECLMTVISTKFKNVDPKSVVRLEDKGK